MCFYGAGPEETTKVARGGGGLPFILFPGVHVQYKIKFMFARLFHVNTSENCFLNFICSLFYMFKGKCGRRLQRHLVYYHF